MSQSEQPNPVTPLTRGAVRLRRTIKALVRSVVYVPLLLLLIIALVVSTPIGSKFGVWLADSFVPGLSVSYASGTLNGELGLEDIQWRNDSTSVALKQLQLNWRPWCLLKGGVCVDAIKAADITVSFTSTATESAAVAEDITPVPTLEQNESTGFKLPVTIALSSANLSNIDVSINQTRYQASQIDLSAHWDNDGLVVERLVGNQLLLDPIAPTADEAPPYDEWPLATLPSISLPFPISVEMARLENTQLKLGDTTENFPLLVLLADINGSQIDLGQLTLVHDSGAISIKGEATLSEQYPLALEAQVSMTHLPMTDEPIVQDAQLAINGNLADLNLTATLDGTQQGQLSAHSNLTDAKLPYRIDMNATHLQWPFNQPEYRAENLTLSSEGSLAAQQAQLSGKLFSPFVEALQINGAVKHQQQQLALENLAVTTSAGAIDINGSLDYANGVTWQLNTQLSQLNLGAIHLVSSAADTEQLRLPDSDIAGPLATEGYYRDGHWQVKVSQVALRGSADQLPFALLGDVQADDSLAIHSNGLTLTALNSRLYLHGNAGNKWDINGSVTIPDLAQWLPNAFGNFSTTVNVSGAAEQPQINLNGKLLNAGWQSYKVAEVDLNGHYQPFNNHQFDVKLNTGEIELQQQLFGRLNAQLQGDLSEQRFQLALEGDNGVSLAGRNQYDAKQQQLQLTLNELSTQGKAGHWQLDAPLVVDWQQTTAQGKVSPFCLSATDNQVCLKQAIDLANPQIELHYAGKPATALAAFLPEGIQWQGEASMDASIKLPPKAKPTAKVQLDLAPGVITFTQQTKNSETVQYQAGQISAILDEDWLHTKATFDAGELAKVNAAIDIATAPEHTLQGQVQLERFNLKFFEQVIPQFQTLEGLLTADLGLAGNLAQPQVSGEAKLQKGALVLSANPTKIDELAVTAQFDGQSMSLDGGWHMGKGSGSVTGDIAWSTGKPSGTIKVNGKELTVIQPPLAIVDVSPDLTINLGDAIHVSGNVNIPSGSITIVPLPAGGVGVSQDVVFDDAQAQQAAQKTATPITADINVSIGNKLSIDGYGLKSLLTGTVNLKQSAGKPAQVYGNINLKDGTYKFMSQTLTISRGELQFIGPPQVPSLNIEAIREIKDEDLVAGVRITGNALKPEVVLFSEPSREQAEVLSYILQGKGFDSSEDNSSMMVGAAISLGSQFSGGGGAMSNISNTAASLVEMFGFNNVQLDTDNEGKVAISGYIGKDLMLKYGVGVFTPGYEVTVRYYLLSQLYLESVSSTVSQSLDIYYSFDIDTDDD
ncbi:translocation/assembly module TamB domain-containing protein [Shewanella sp. C32]|uniref:Translocation/assembly module TamB domain-containing protein n=1 Tax=Shewanella electrica TaxID=515560 RepID=A0ABT2FRY5_9GAMM|nr:translocation/assembly module TamB domain-containing protein [Shewanella electrica]MCH1926735.1 translocation/assembly module TamB domain-containing protein [Shewanella electrica]MCS4558004.1 translocation/assembly module TamB domain-containing protein [Shewanella electrica]